MRSIVLFLGIALGVVGCGGAGEMSERADQPQVASTASSDDLFAPLPEPPTLPADEPPAVSADDILESVAPGTTRRRFHLCESTVKAPGTYAYHDVQVAGTISCREAVAVVRRFARATKRVERKHDLDCWPGLCQGANVPDELVLGFRTTVADYSDVSPQSTMLLRRPGDIIRAEVFDDS